jgi:hypothetical protein
MGTTLLAQIITAELAQPIPNKVLALTAEIRRRHGAAVAAILFYGSCLRTENTQDGVLDFYVLVDSYRAAYSSSTLVWLNALLPPNVFYLEVRDGQRTARAKYAVMSTADFERAASPRGVHAIVWGRFCQPTLLVYARDELARAAVVRSLVQAAITMVTRMVALVPASANTQRFRPADLWQRGFEETYRAELRAESRETIQEIYQAAPDRYNRVALAVLRELEQQGLLQVRVEGDRFCITMPAWQRQKARLGWKLRRPIAKGLYMVRLLKSAGTFADWLPYVLWKIGRHAGSPMEPTERQRRHPFLLGGARIVKLLLQRSLR